MVVASLAVAGCGSASVRDLPPAAEPRDSPPPAVSPDGTQIVVGGSPEGLAFDRASGTLAVGLRDPDGVALVDAATGRLEHTVALPANPRHAAAGGGVFYVPAEAAGQLYAIRARDGRVLWHTPVGPFPHGVAALPGGAVVGTERGNQIVFARAGHVSARVPVAVQPGGVAAVGAAGRVAVVSVRERVMELYSAIGSHPRVASAPAGVGPTHVVAAGNLAFVADTQGDALLVYKLAPQLVIVNRLRLASGPYGIAIDPARRRVWVSLTGTNRLAEVSATAHPRLLAEFATVRQPNDVAVDSQTGRVFVAGTAGRSVQVLDAP